MTSNGAEESGLKLCQRVRFRLHTRKNFFTKRIFKPWNRLLRKALELPVLEPFKKGVAVSLRVMV